MSNQAWWGYAMHTSQQVIYQIQLEMQEHCTSWCWQFSLACGFHPFKPPAISNMLRKIRAWKEKAKTQIWAIKRAPSSESSFHSRWGLWKMKVVTSLQSDQIVLSTNSRRERSQIGKQGITCHEEEDDLPFWLISRLKTFMWYTAGYIGQLTVLASGPH